MGGYDIGLSGSVEPTLKYHSFLTYLLTSDQADGQCLVGSLTGAVASQRVTEAPKGFLGPDGNRPKECIGRRKPDREGDNPTWGESRAK